MHASRLTITARTPSPVALRLCGDTDRRTDPTNPRDNDTNQVRQQRPHALEITRRRSSPAAGQHTEATRRTPSREVRQIHFRRASSRSRKDPDVSDFSLPCVVDLDNPAKTRAGQHSCARPSAC
ncbi:hypothetical protein COO55_09310 [Rhodococcus opacus]|nr:hypothetical protein COO55_09310 [Rhodococcus opacus]